MIRLLSPAFLFFLYVQGSAQQNGTPDQNPDSIRLKEIVLMARTARPQHGGLTPSESISGAQLQVFAPVDYAGALNAVPGAQLQSGAVNTNRISIRGIGARTPFGTDKLRMYYNGIPVTNGAGVSVIEAFDLDNLSQIEIVKGPYGSRYGSPLGGVLLLESIEVPDGGQELSNRTIFGSFGLLKQHIRFQSLDTETQYALSFNNTRQEGYRQNSSFDRHGFLLQGEHRSGPRSQLGLLINALSYTAQIPSTLSRDDYEAFPEQAAANWLQARGFEQNQYLLSGLYHRWQVDKGMLLRSSVFYSYLDHYEARPFNILTDYTHTLGARVELLDSGTYGSASFGLESLTDIYRWRTYENQIDPSPTGGSNPGDLLSRNREFRTVHSAYIQAQRRISPSLTLGAAVSANLTRYQFRSFFGAPESIADVERLFDPILLPKVEALWSRANAEWYLRVGRGFSNPGIEEALTPEGVLNPDIRQEKGVSYEAGYRGLWKNVNLSVSAYQMNVSDLLVARRFDEEQFIGVNAGATRHRGLEVVIGADWGGEGRSLWQSRLAYAFSDFTFTDFVDQGVDFKGNRLPGVPEHYLHASFRWLHPSGFELTWTHEYSDVIPVNDANSVYAEAYHLDRLHLSYRMELRGGWSLGGELGLNNLFDVQYARSFAINAVGFGPNPPRYFYPGEPLNVWGGVNLGIRW